MSLLRLHRWAWTALLLSALAQPTVRQIPKKSESPAKSEPSAQVATDPLGRSTPPRAIPCSERTWRKGLKPAEQRAAKLGDYRIADFHSTAQAAYAYALNLNTGRAYRDLRLKRADLRRQSLRISGTVLADTLLKYSERGQAYVDDLMGLIRQNRLDDAYLRQMAVIHIVPPPVPRPSRRSRSRKTAELVETVSILLLPMGHVRQPSVDGLE